MNSKGYTQLKWTLVLASLSLLTPCWVFAQKKPPLKTNVPPRAQPNTPPPASAQTLNQYEFAVAMVTFIQRLEGGLSEATGKPISTRTGTQPQGDPKHPPWARKAVAELRARGLLPSNQPFEGNQPLTRYEFARILTRYIQKLDAVMIRNLGKPVRTFKAKELPTLKVAKTHPAYSAMVFLARNRWLEENSPVFRGPQERLTVQQVADAWAFVALRFVERYTLEPQWKPDLGPPPRPFRGIPPTLAPATPLSPGGKRE